MQIVINIDNDVYKRALVYKDVQLTSNSANDLSELITAVANGTPLPDEYGDLVDRNAINDRFYSILAELEALPNKPTHKEVLNKLSMCLDTAEPIIKHNYEEVEVNTDGGNN